VLLEHGICSNPSIRTKTIKITPWRKGNERRKCKKN